MFLYTSIFYEKTTNQLLFKSKKEKCLLLDIDSGSWANKHDCERKRDWITIQKITCKNDSRFQIVEDLNNQVFLKIPPIMNRLGIPLKYNYEHYDFPIILSSIISMKTLNSFEIPEGEIAHVV